MSTGPIPTPLQAGYRQPAEWEPHAACWTAWPHLVGEWGGELDAARRELVAMCDAIVDADPVTGARRGEEVRVLVSGDAERLKAEAAFEGVEVTLIEMPIGDIWLRDTGPLFLTDALGRLAAARFRWNGWGGKYVFEHDDRVAAGITDRHGVQTFDHPWVLEGGAIDVDGEGTLLTTRQCLLNENRNPGMSQASYETALSHALGVEKVLWLGEGLANDHTDGHVDTVARFTRPGTVVCMRAEGSDDPNRDTLRQIEVALREMTDARGRRVEVFTLPSPGRVEDAVGQVMPASYVNFYIGNRAVVVPTYGSPWDEVAVSRLQDVFPDRRVVGLSARAILVGGGAFHCITQQEPSSRGIADDT